MGLGLWLTRGSTFTADELVFFAEPSGFSPADLLHPYGSHLVFVSHLLFQASLTVFGTAHVPIQIMAMLTAAAAAGALFLLLRRLTSPLLALAAALLVLFWGCTPESIEGAAIMWTQPMAAGLFALFAFDHGTRRWDAAACAALVFAILSTEVGVMLAGAVVVWIIAQRRGWRRLWVPAVPLLLYAAWWLWAMQFGQDALSVAGPVSIAGYALDSAAGGAVALSGLGLPFDPSVQRVRLTELWLGYPLLAALLALVAAGLRGRRPPPIWWAALAYLIAFWIAGALAENFFRYPEATRYSYAVGIGLLVLLAASWRGRKASPGAALALAGVALLALVPNLWQLRERGADVRVATLQVRAGLAAPDLLPERAERTGLLGMWPPLIGSKYVAAADRYGSLGMTPAELRAQPEAIQRYADRSLLVVADPRLASRPASACDTRGSDATASAPLPIGGAVLRSRSGTELLLHRFGEHPNEVDLKLAPGRPARLRLPVDSASAPWVVSAEPGKRLEVCGGRGAR